MKKIAIYGKGGIGKSTTVSNIAVALARQGLTVMQIGCDPKADSTLSLRSNITNTIVINEDIDHDNSKENTNIVTETDGSTSSECSACNKTYKTRSNIKTVLDLIRERGNDFTLDDMAVRGAYGVICVEAGGPTPGVGCAGRGIIAALDKLKEKGAYEIFKPDVVLYDVLGDVVCGGFSMPMRAGYADKVYIITSGENMSIHAAANIAMAVQGFKSKGYAELGGFILNHHDVKNENEKVQELADDFETEIVGELSRSTTVQKAEELGKTVMEAFPDSEMADEYRKLAGELMKG